MPQTDQFIFELKSLLGDCGYGSSRLAIDYNLNGIVLPLVGFAAKPWDLDSACIAVVEANGDATEAVRSCYDLAAPIVWVRNSGSVDWWVQHANSPRLFASHPIAEFPKILQQHKAQLKPASVYRGKTIAKIDRQKQLAFVDVGLMPLRREEAGRKLGDLIEEMTRSALRTLGKSNPSKTALHKVFAASFRLLAGKILKDKNVPGFGSIEFSKPETVLAAVIEHYGTTETHGSLTPKWKKSLQAAAALLDGAGSFSVVSAEALSYVYEHTLVTKSLRKKLGIHATPPWLVDYIVWSLYDWIREIPPDNRHIFEPACGHAPFLISAMRLLRVELQDEPDDQVHDYLKNRLHGVEVDPFAREIARLSLTLADIPHRDGWDLRSGDMYESNILREEAARCSILLCNPPYERFTTAAKRQYVQAGFPVQHRKAVELLDRTIPHLQPGALFGVVVPQGVLHNTEAREIRDILLKEYDLREICLFADRVFEWGDAETAILLGRRRAGDSSHGARTTIRRVREYSIPGFAKSYEADAEQKLPQEKLGTDAARTLRLPELADVWALLSQYPVIGDVADVGQGFSFARKGLVDRARKRARQKSSDAVPVFLSGVGSLSIWQTPPSVWLSPSHTPVKTWRSGQYTDKPQVLVNYSPVMRGPWRIKALLDASGHAVTNTYTTVRPRMNGRVLTFLWAILNSPIANAYVYCNALKRHIYDSLIASLPIPLHWENHIASIVEAANSYLRLVREQDDFMLSADSSAICKALLAMDAAVMRAYALPARKERAVLDLFRLPPVNKNARRRKGVGCTFGDYFPADLKSSIPLWMYISESYQRSTPKDILDNLPTVTDPELIEALQGAE